RWYRPENCTIIVAGDVDHDRLVALVKKEYGAWKPGKPQPEIPVEPKQKEPQSAHLGWPLPTLPTLYIGYHAPAADPKNPDVAALGALSEAVFGETSPLYRALVLEEQKVVILQADSESKRDPGLFTIFARIRKPEDLPEVRRRIEEALADAARTPIDPQRLQAIQNHVRYAFAGSLDSADAVAVASAQSIALTNRPDS